MSSTEPASPETSPAQAAEARLRRFFEERLTPAAESLRQRGVRFFDSAPTSESVTEDASWWQPAPTWPDLSELDPERWVDTLVELWRNQGLDELVALAPELAELASELELGEESDADLSPFLYVMY